MLKVRQRLRRLEEELIPDPDLPKTMTIQFVDSERRVVAEKVITFGNVRPSTRRWGVIRSGRR